jgi:hypothetical protein
MDFSITAVFVLADEAGRYILDFCGNDQDVLWEHAKSICSIHIREDKAKHICFYLELKNNKDNSLIKTEWIYTQTILRDYGKIVSGMDFSIYCGEEQID